MTSIRVLGTARPPFLILTPVCLTLAWSVGSSGTWQDPVSFAIACIGALAAHVAVNALNECDDYRSGLDLNTDRTPFSGGSGTLVRYPELVWQAQLLATGALALVIGCGIYLLTQRGAAILPFGVAGLLLAIFYTNYLTRQPLLCLLCAGSGFALLMIPGAYLALTGTVDAKILAASIPVFFVVNNLLLLNQFPDRTADQSHGRRTLPAVAGTRNSAAVYGLFNGLAIVSLVAAVARGVLPTGTLLGVAPLSAGFVVMAGALRYGGDTPRLVPYMALNVAICILTPLALASGFRLS